jgi:hypothetical protein
METKFFSGDVAISSRNPGSGIMKKRKSSGNARRRTAAGPRTMSNTPAITGSWDDTSKSGSPCERPTT